MPTQPRGLPVINEQLKELRDFIHRFQEVGATDFASDLHLSSLQYQESIFVEELKAANLIQGSTAIQIAIDGSPVENHAIDTAFLGPFLLYLQKLVNATGQALEGVSTSRGVVQERVQSQNRLRVSSLMATSFGLNFVIEDQPQSPSLFEETPNNRTLDVVTSLFNGDIKEDDVAFLISYPRVKKHYERLVRLVSEMEASVQVRTRSLPLGVKLSAQEAQKRSKWLENFKPQEKSIRITGTLTAANVRLYNFEIFGEDNRIYTGKMGSHVVNWAARYLGQRVNAEMRMTTLVHKETGIVSSPSYFLRELNKVEEREVATVDYIESS